MSDPNQSYDQEPTLSDLAMGIWRQRAVIVSIVSAAAVLAALLVAVLVSKSPRTHDVSLPFRLEFSGAQEQRYPNGTPFRPSDIVSSSVVRPLFDSSDLQRFLDYEDFKAALAVVERNDRLDMLRREFEARLSNSRLSQAERREIEDEFEARMSAARTGEYHIRLHDPQARIPVETAQALLPAILERWGEEAQRVHGAWLYDIAVPNRGIIDEDAIIAEDYLIGTDMLRAALQRIDQSAIALQQVPGANLVRLQDDTAWSLTELRSRLSDVIRYQIDPLNASIFSVGFFRNPDAAEIYLRHRLMLLRLEVEALEGKSDTINDVLGALQRSGASATSPERRGGSGSSVIIPQIGEGLFEAMMDIGVHTADVDYRRELSKKQIELRNEMIDIKTEMQQYELLLSMLGDAVEKVDDGLEDVALDDEQHAQAIAAMETRFENALAMTHTIIDRLQALHRQISAQHLQPHRIAAVTGPVRHRQVQALNMRTLLGVVVAILMLGGFIALVVAWLRSINRNRNAPSASAQ